MVQSHHPRKILTVRLPRRERPREGENVARKVLLLQGSPRRRGNTARLADAFEQGAREAGCEVARFDVAHMRIAGCKGCHACWRNGGRCVVDDDMQEIYPYADGFDTIAFATPVYFFSYSAQIKAALDRLEAKMGTDERPFKSCALLATYYQAPDSGTIEPVLALYRKVASYLGWHDEGCVCVPHMDGPADIEGNPALDEARRLGKGLA